MHVIVEFGWTESPGPERNRVDFAVVSQDGEDGGGSVVGGVGLNSNLSTRNPVMENGGLHECALEGIESCLALQGPVPAGAGLGEPGQRNTYFGVIPDEPAIEVAEAKEGLNVLDLLRSGPFRDGGDLVRSHSEAIRREDITKIFASGDAKLALGEFTEKAVSAEAPEYFLYMLGVLRIIVGVDEDIIQIDDDVDVEQVSHDGVQEALESGRSIRKALRDDPEVI
jgi:hypothetical protein